MKDQAVPAKRRDRPLPDDLPPEFVRNAHMLAIQRAARDAHGTVCDRDVVECSACRGHAAAIAQAKRLLNDDADVR